MAEQKTQNITLTPDQFAAYKNAMDLLQKVNGNPDARRKMESAFKVLNPNLETEEDIAARYAQPFVEQLNATNETLKSLKEELAKRDADAVTATENQRFDRAMTWLDGQGYTDEGKEAIKKIMTEEKIPVVEAAAALFDKRNPKPIEIPGSNYEGDSWNFRGDPKDDNLKQLFENEDAWADREAAMTLNTMRRQAAAAQAA